MTLLLDSCFWALSIFHAKTRTAVLTLRRCSPGFSSSLVWSAVKRKLLTDKLSGRERQRKIAVRKQTRERKREREACVCVCSFRLGHHRAFHQFATHPFRTASTTIILTPFTIDNDHDILFPFFLSATFSVVFRPIEAHLYPRATAASCCIFVQRRRFQARLSITSDATPNSARLHLGLNTVASTLPQQASLAPFCTCGTVERDLATATATLPLSKVAFSALTALLTSSV